MLRKETVSSSLLETLTVLMEMKTIKTHRLVGGTALALQIGRRTSVDIDLFSDDKNDYEKIQEELFEIFGNKFAKVGGNYFPINFLRIFITCLLIVPFVLSGHYKELLILYLVPAFFIYPQLAWISQIVEHRWFVEFESEPNKHKRELIIGRPTEYKGISGFFIRACIFPFGDSFHLAHSLFQYARYNYLKTINEILSSLLVGTLNFSF